MSCCESPHRQSMNTILMFVGSKISCGLSLIFFIITKKQLKRAYSKWYCDFMLFPLTLYIFFNNMKCSIWDGVLQVIVSPTLCSATHNFLSSSYTFVVWTRPNRCGVYFWPLFQVYPKSFLYSLYECFYYSEWTFAWNFYFANVAFNIDECNDSVRQWHS